MQSDDTIEGKCTVLSFKTYTKLDAVGNEDYFCRFEYNSVTGDFTPDRVAVYCKCELPYNLDDLMVQCEGCNDWWPTLKDKKDLEGNKEEERKIETQRRKKKIGGYVTRAATVLNRRESNQQVVREMIVARRIRGRIVRQK